MSENLIERFLDKHKKWIEKHLIQERERIKTEEALTDAQILKLKKEAREYLTAKTECFSKIMNVKCGRIIITGAKTRFGSCSSKGNISYSYRLMLYPEAARDYVVVHELAHLKEMNHSKRFYDVVTAVMPDYKERKKLLK